MRASYFVSVTLSIIWNWVPVIPRAHNLSIVIPFRKPDRSDLYLCTSISVDSRRHLYIEGFTPLAEMSIVHHMLLYGCEEPGGGEAETWTCGGMGSSTPERPVCSGRGTRILYAWARNAPQLRLPDDVAFRIGGNTGIHSLVVQFHFGDHHRMTDMPAMHTGNIGLTLQVSREKPKHLAGVYLLIAGGAIPPRSSVHLETACVMEENKVIYPFAFRTHSHSLGRVISGYRVRKRGRGPMQWTMIGKKDPQLPQMFYPVATSAPVAPGDVLAARCTMESNRTTTTFIGPGSNDEMCNFYIMYHVAEGEDVLENESCSGGTPDENFWTRGSLHLDNIPEDASSL